MSSDNNNHGSEMLFGAVILILALGMIVIKALKQFFMELGQAFEAFAGMVGSFTLILWNTAQVVFLIGLIISTVFCAIYFSIQYYKMVKEGTALREWTKATVKEFEEKLLKRFDCLVSLVNDEVQDMDRRLTKALKKPEVAPEAEGTTNDSTETGCESQLNSEANNSDMTTQTSNDSKPEDSRASVAVNAEKEKTTDLDTKTPEVTMSNPY